MKCRHVFLSFVLLVTAAGSAQASALYFSVITNDNPIGYWRLGETNVAGYGNVGPSTNSYDSVPPAQNGFYRDGTYRTIEPGLGYSGAISSDANTSVRLDGVNNGGWFTTNTPPPTGGVVGSGADNWTSRSNNAAGNVSSVAGLVGSTYSMEVWFYNERPTNQLAVTGYMTIRGGDTGFDAVGIGGTDTTFGNVAGKLTFFNASTQLNGATIIQTGTWYHIVMVRSNTTNIKVYLDGALEISGTASLTYNVTSDFQDDFFLGVRGDGFWPFQGRVDEFAIYNYALTPAQVLNHYTVGITVDPEAEVPEPSTIVFLSLGIISLILRLRS